jgi:hypothetical protein
MFSPKDAAQADAIDFRFDVDPALVPFKLQGECLERRALRR